MKYWLTTHWPPRVDDPDPDTHHGVWLQHDKLHVAEGMQRDDLVLIYEAGSGKVVRETYPDGSPKIVQRRPGRQGVVTLARILDRPSQPQDSRPEQYADGSSKWWRFMAPTEPLNTAGFISRADLAASLHYKPGYVFRGFGRDHSGLAEIDEEEFKKLLSRFLEPLAARDTLTKRYVTGRRWSGQGGEGPAHRALKLAIAADPTKHLGEPGLRHWATEYKLPTGDTVDVVLTDEFGRFVVVEVEVDCDETEIIGPLQSMKYRALMSYMHDRPLNEVRSLLVACTIHDDVRARCHEHRIDCRLGSRTLIPTEVSPSPTAGVADGRL